MSSAELYRNNASTIDLAKEKSLFRLYRMRFVFSQARGAAADGRTTKITQIVQGELRSSHLYRDEPKWGLCGHPGTELFTQCSTII